MQRHLSLKLPLRNALVSSKAVDFLVEDDAMACWAEGPEDLDLDGRAVSMGRILFLEADKLEETEGFGSWTVVKIDGVVSLHDSSPASVGCFLQRQAVN